MTMLTAVPPRPRPARRVAIAVSVAATLLLSLVACSSSSGSSGGGSASGGTAAGSGSAAPADLSGVSLRVGQTGWAQTKAVLDIAGQSATPYSVTWSVFSGGDKQLQALNAGALDVAQASEIPPIFAAAAAKPDFAEVAVQPSTTLQQEVVVAKGSPLKTIADLKGKKVGYVQNTTAQYFLYKLLVAAGLKWTDVQTAPLAPADGVAALNSGAIDALATYGNSVIAVHAAGGTAIGTGEKILSGNFPWVAANSVIADAGQKAALADLLARINTAYAMIHNSPALAEKFAEATNTATQQPTAQALQIYQQGEAQHPSKIIAVNQAAISSQQSVADAFTDLGAISKLDVSTIWSTALSSELTPLLQKAPTESPLPSASPSASSSK
jgi:sulfonate transport system substrate-binding protein